MSNLLNEKLIKEIGDKKINIIYLDIDGVISTAPYRYNIDPNKVKMLLDYLETNPNTYIVLSSTWRMSTYKKTIEKYKPDSTRGDITPLFKYLLGVTTPQHDMRGNQIDSLNCLLKNGYEMKFNYVILDDDTDMLYKQRNNFIKTNTYYGINIFDIIKMRDILNVDNFEYDYTFKVVFTSQSNYKDLKNDEMGLLVLSDKEGELINLERIISNLNRFKNIVSNLSNTNLYILDIEEELSKIPYYSLEDIIKDPHNPKAFFKEFFRDYVTDMPHNFKVI